VLFEVANQPRHDRGREVQLARGRREAALLHDLLETPAWIEDDPYFCLDEECARLPAPHTLDC